MPDSYPTAHSGEEFREIPGLSGYLAGNNGTILSCKKKWIKETTELGKPLLVNDKSDYLRVGIRRQGWKSWVTIHELVLLAFVGPRPEGKTGHHVNLNRRDNRPENLVWKTHEEIAAIYPVPEEFGEYKSIPGFPGYIVTKNGFVLSQRGTSDVHGPWKIIKPNPLPPRGYLIVHLGKSKRFYVHDLAAKAFNGPKPPGLHVRHLDDNRDNNNADNLAYGTRTENMQDAIRNGKLKRGEENNQAKITDEMVLEIRKKYQDGLMLKDIAPLFGISSAQVGNICRHKHWKHV